MREIIEIVFGIAGLLVLAVLSIIGFSALMMFSFWLMGWVSYFLQLVLPQAPW